jgi:hypothetical protein
MQMVSPKLQRLQPQHWWQKTRGRKPTTSAAAAPASTASRLVSGDRGVGQGAGERASVNVGKMIDVCKAILERLAEGVTPFRAAATAWCRPWSRDLLNSTLQPRFVLGTRTCQRALQALHARALLATGISRRHHASASCARSWSPLSIPSSSRALVRPPHTHTHIHTHARAD